MTDKQNEAKREFKMDKYDFSDKYKKLIIESYKDAKFDIDHYQVRCNEGEGHYQHLNPIYDGTYWDNKGEIDWDKAFDNTTFPSYEDLVDHLKNNFFPISDDEIFDLFESDDEGKFINEWAEKLDPEYYNSDDFDFDLFEEIHEIYTKNWEKIPRIDSSSEYDRLIFRQSLDIGELNKNCKLPWYERRSR